jgi:hypothetical protein
LDLTNRTLWLVGAADNKALYWTGHTRTRTVTKGLRVNAGVVNTDTMTITELLFKTQSRDKDGLVWLSDTALVSTEPKLLTDRHDAFTLWLFTDDSEKQTSLRQWDTVTGFSFTEYNQFGLPKTAIVMAHDRTDLLSKLADALYQYDLTGFTNYYIKNQSQSFILSWIEDIVKTNTDLFNLHIVWS